MTSLATGFANPAKLTANHFEPFVGNVFEVTNLLSETKEKHVAPQSNAESETEVVKVKLVEVKRYPQTSEQLREQFSLLFESPTRLLDATLAVSHHELGQGRLFFSCVAAPSEDGSTPWMHESAFS